MTALTTIAAVGALAGAAVGAVGSIQQGKAAQAQSKFQAAVMQQQADREREIAAQEEQDFRRNQQRLMATRRAMLGSSGVDPSTGSPLLSSIDFAEEAEFQALRIRAGGDTRATRLQQSAQLQRMAGRNARTSSMFQAGGSLLSGAERTASILRDRGDFG